MNRMNKTILCGLLLCLFGAAGKGYGQEVKPGTVLWEFETEGTSEVSAPAIGGDGTVYFPSGHGVLYALDGKTGTKKTEFITGAGIISTPVVSPDNTIFVGSHNNKHFYAFNGNKGIKKWEFETLEGRVLSAAIGANGLVYLVSNFRIIYALDQKTGSKKWDFEPKVKHADGWRESSPAVGGDGTVYVASLGSLSMSQFIYVYPSFQMLLYLINISDI